MGGRMPFTDSRNNAPKKAGILGGILITLLSGRKRYVPVNVLRHGPRSFHRCSAWTSTPAETAFVVPWNEAMTSATV